MADAPHFKYPFRFVNNKADVVEQDSEDDILSCVEVILRCPINHRDDKPEFGIPDPLFREVTQQLNITDIEEAVLRWEPRADVEFSQQIDELVVNLLAMVDARQGEQ
jgi:phage baseplate assembly protein W